jgi:DNA polymerase (family 10)
MLAALQNEHLKIIAHPTGRILQQRDAAGFDLAAVFRAAAERRVYLEINGSPARLDLPDTHCMKARDYAVRFALISPPVPCGIWDWGCNTRGWLEAG